METSEYQEHEPVKPIKTKDGKPHSSSMSEMPLHLLLKKEFDNQSQKIFAFLKSQDRRIHEVEDSLDTISSNVNALGKKMEENLTKSTQRMDSIIHDISVRLGKIEDKALTSTDNSSRNKGKQGLQLDTGSKISGPKTYSDIIRDSPVHLQEGIQGLIQGTRRFINQNRPTSPRNEIESNLEKRLFYVSGWVRAPIKEIKDRLKKAYFSLRSIKNIRWVGLTTLEFLVDAEYSSKFSFQVKKLNGYLTLVEDYDLERSPNMSDTPEAKSVALERFIKGICLQMVSTSKIEVVNFFLRQLYAKPETYHKKALGIIPTLRQESNNVKVDLLLKLIPVKGLVSEPENQSTVNRSYPESSSKDTAAKQAQENIDVNRPTVEVTRDLIKASRYPEDSKNTLCATLDKIQEAITSSERSRLAFEGFLCEVIEMEEFKDRCLTVLDPQDELMADTSTDFMEQEGSIKKEVKIFHRKVMDHLLLMETLRSSLERHEGKTWSVQKILLSMPSELISVSESYLNGICEKIAANISKFLEDKDQANLFIRQIFNEVEQLFELGESVLNDLSEEIDILDSLENIDNIDNTPISMDEVDLSMEQSNE
jgi:hypothetical protein